MSNNNKPTSTPLRRQSNRFLRTSRVVRNLNAVVGKQRGGPSVGAAATSSRKWVLQEPLLGDEDETRLSALSQRLEEILIMELHRDGARDFLQFTVRGLYKHVISAITAAPHGLTHTHQLPLKSSLHSVVEQDDGANDDDHHDADEDGERQQQGRSVSFHEQVTVQPPPYQATPTLPTKSKLARVASARASVFGMPQPSLGSIGSREGEDMGVGGGGTGAGAIPHEDLTFRERIGGYLHPRDMRRLVTPFSASNEPALIVRRHVMLLNFDPLRAVILRDRLLVLVPHGADSLLSKLERRVRGGAKGAENSVFGTASEVESNDDDDDDDNGSASDRSVQDSTDNLEVDQEDVRKKPISVDSQKGRGVGVGTSGTAGSMVGPDGAPLSSAMRRNMEDLLKHNKPIRPLHHKGSGSGGGSGDEAASTGASLSRKNSGESGDAADMVTKIANSLQGFLGSQTAPVVRDSCANDDTSMNSEWEEMNARNWIDLPFELQCADAVLSVVCSILSEDAYELQEAALGYIDSVVTGKFRIGEDPLTGLRHTKDAIREMSSRVKGFVQSMNRILDDDEDMALMNLSRLLTHPERFIKPVNQVELEEEADEPELILEAHLQIGLTLMNALDLIQGQVDSASDLVDQKLDSVRNRILFANMIISIFSFSMTTAAVVGSFFGMNVEVPYGENHNGLGPFTVVVTSTIVGAILIVVITLAILFYSRAIPLPGGSTG